MKKNIFLFTSVVILGVIIALIIISRQNDAGITEVKTYDEYVKWLTKVQSEEKLEIIGIHSGCESEKECKEYFESKHESFTQISKGSPVFLHGEFSAMIVEVGETYLQYNGSFEQNAIIKKVFTGCEYPEETEISVITVGGTRVDEDGNVKLTFSRCNFPMIPGERYLLFCEETEISDEMSKPQFRSFVGEWTYINLDNSKVLEITDETSIEEILSYSMVTEDSYATKYFLEIREEILKNYDLSDT